MRKDLEIILKPGVRCYNAHSGASEPQVGRVGKSSPGRGVSPLGGKSKRSPHKRRDKTPILAKVKRLIPVGYWVIAFLKFLLELWKATR
jgi:hypothetical protein